MATVELKDASDMPTLRVVCSCRSLGHNLDIAICKDVPNDLSFIEINTQEHSSFSLCGWEKVKAVWRLLRGKPICLGGVVVTSSDLKDIADFIERNL